MRIADIDELRLKLLARPRLWSASIEITARCNLRCVHCLRVHADDDGLSFAEVCDVLDQLRALGCFQIVFTGGEPFARRDFMDIVEQAWRGRFGVTIMTNATMLTAGVVEQCKRNHVSEVQVSVYSMDERVHDAITQQDGSYRRTTRGIELALAAGLNVRIATPITSLNADDVPAVRSLWRQRGATFVGGSLLFPRQDGDPAPLSMVASGEQLERVLAGDDNAASTRQPPADATAPASSLCPAGIERLGIGLDGAIYPCDALRVVAGNVRSQALAGVWEHSAVLESLRSRRREHGAACTGCGVRSKCTWCPGLSRQLMGDMGVPNPQDCRRTRLTYVQRAADLPGWSIPANLCSV
jgi:radical SAM protein with 4Fe4S-binding SPASM domain